MKFDTEQLKEDFGRSDETPTWENLIDWLSDKVCPDCYQQNCEHCDEVDVVLRITKYLT